MKHHLLKYSCCLLWIFQSQVLKSQDQPANYPSQTLQASELKGARNSNADDVASTLETTAASTPMAKCKGKYLGNIIQSSTTSGSGLNYNTYWNQATSENGSKWGSVEGSQGNYSWTSSDAAYNWAKNNNGLFKYHNFVWGSQTPSWVSGASVATIQAAVQNYIKACSTHYTPLGGLKMIDVVNEPVNTGLTANYKAALTAGYQAEPANAADKNNQYGWVIWPYQLARKYFPNAVLLINEYNTEMNWNSCRAPYLAMANAVKNAPNLTDGKKNLIDGIGLQCHGVDNLTAANFKSYLDEIWTKTGLPAHITEFDQEANPNEAKQQTVFSTLLPIAWEHAHVAGITIWGYVQGSTWRNGNGTKGASGTDSGIMYTTGGERPALTWLKNYMASQKDLSCCPAPAPLASCTVVTEVEDHTETQTASVYPNPFQEGLHLVYAGDFTYQFTNASGQLIETGRGYNEATIGQQAPKGLYLLKISQNNTHNVVKVVKE